jgi:hypothetical protein
MSDAADRLAQAILNLLCESLRDITEKTNLGGSDAAKTDRWGPRSWRLRSAMWWALPQPFNGSRLPLRTQAAFGGRYR